MNRLPIGPELIPRERGFSHRLLVDAGIAMILLASSGLWATQFWNTWTARGGKPAFYQSYFEPAVMLACGKGFLVSESPRPQVLDDFLHLRRDSITCADLPGDLRVGTNGLYQGVWLYLQTLVGWTWRLLGISWSGMAPLFGLLFGVVVSLAYGIFRLGMGRLAAVGCALGLATSYLHLTNLPHLRDYGKAPFTLALVLILGILVTRPVRPRLVLGLAAAYGTVLGIGYGFRTDFLVDLPLFVMVLFGFLPGGLVKNFLLKASGLLVFMATFVIVSWPVTSAVYAQGGCQWHVSLLGLQAPFEQRLQLDPAPYDFGYVYADGFVIRGVQGFARRTQPDGTPSPQYCSPEYDVQSGRYLMAFVTAFPADFVARAYASIVQIVELPFAASQPPAEGWAATLFAGRAALIGPLHSWGALLTAAAVVGISAASIRLGFFSLFFLAYFGGYPAVQFQERHYFHLEFMGWFALGCALHRIAIAGSAARNGQRVAAQDVRLGAFRIAVVMLSGAVASAGLLGATRWYQQREARQLFDAYIAAAKIPLEDPASPLIGVAKGDWPQYLEVDLDERACGPRPAVTFRYDAADRDGDFTRTMTVERRATRPGPTRILLPVFESYTGLEFSDPSPGCVLGAYQFTRLETLPLLLGATLPPDWESLPLYARLARH